jgi:chromosome segregation ATPase
MVPTTTTGGTEADMLQQRLQVGLGIATGARGSLLRGQTTLSVTDVRLAQLELQQLYYRVERQEQECHTAAAAVEDDVVSSNEALRRQLQEVQALHHAYLEYEALAAASMTRTNTATLHAEYDQLLREKEGLQGELQSVQEKLRMVQTQYHLLQQCLQDLKQEP